MISLCPSVLRPWIQRMQKGHDGARGVGSGEEQVGEAYSKTVSLGEVSLEDRAKSGKAEKCGTGENFGETPGECPRESHIGKRTTKPWISGEAFRNEHNGMCQLARALVKP